MGSYFFNDFLTIFENLAIKYLYFNFHNYILIFKDGH